MTARQSVSASLHGALLLARGHAQGILFMEGEARGVALSFWAILLSLPSVIYMATANWPVGTVPPHAALLLTRHAAVFVVAWLLFAVFSHRMAPRLHRAHLWPRMIIAWNWCGVPENVLLMAGTLPGLFGAPHVIDQVAQVATLGWALWIEWFAIRVAFAAGPLLALSLLVLDQALGIAVTLFDLSFARG